MNENFPMDLLRKAVLFGIGSVDYTREKVEEFVKELTKEKKLSVEEGRKFVDEVLNRASEVKYKQQGEVKRVIKSVLDEMGLATKQDLEDLKKSFSKTSAKKEAKK